ncbi:calcium-binding protein [Microvirga pakistanensis]|uniref:calcium-binding protein n=1 Tax=Microvirga pakistanensis TaxID=1682650 RepID=UPI00141BEABB|nr:calcium-binding protein [Microvirga pakistanensis]
MAITTKTVAEYLAGAPFPPGSIAIVDTAEAINTLTFEQIAALAGNGVVSLNANPNDAVRVSLTWAEFQALGTVALSADDVIELADTEAAIRGLSQAQVNALNAKGVDVIDADGGSLQVNANVAAWVGQTNLTFDAADLVTISDSDIKLSFFSAQQITALSNKGIDVFDSTTNTFSLAGADRAIAMAQSNIVLAEGDDVSLSLNSQELSRLSIAHLTSLGIKGLDSIDAADGKLTLSLEQYDAITNPLQEITLTADDQVTIALSLTDLAILRDSEIAEFATNNVDDVSLNASGQILGTLSPSALFSLADRGVTIIDASDNVLGLTLAQYNAISPVGGMKLTVADNVTLSASYDDMTILDDEQIADMRANGVDVLTLKATGQALGALTVEQISALATRGVNVFDAQDNRLTLTNAQYAVLHTIGLSAADVVTISSSASHVLSSQADHLTLAGNALRGTGNSLSNKLIGNAKSNTLSGLNGNDTLGGGLGNDTLYGGRNKDVFVFDTRPNKSSNRDTIKDFSVADDTIWLDNAIFTKLGSGSLSSPRKLASSAFAIGSKAADSSDRIVYDKKTGYLSYDADGSGKGAAIIFAKINTGLKMTASDFYVI